MRLQRIERDSVVDSTSMLNFRKAPAQKLRRLQFLRDGVEIKIGRLLSAAPSFQTIPETRSQPDPVGVRGTDSNAAKCATPGADPLRLAGDLRSSIETP